jgi:hypothetical protein
MNTEHTVVIIPFIYLKEPIKTLNIEWLSKYFKIEPKDELVLSNLRRKLSIKVE